MEAQNMHPAVHGGEDSAKARGLYTALALCDMSWRLALGDGRETLCAEQRMGDYFVYNSPGVRCRPYTVLFQNHLERISGWMRPWFPRRRGLTVRDFGRDCSQARIGKLLKNSLNISHADLS
jgi:hypothetical protein